MRKKEITTTLIVTTYNRPDALEAVLESVRTQVWMPDEVIVADDGSRDETRSLIKRYMNDLHDTAFSLFLIPFEYQQSVFLTLL